MYDALREAITSLGQPRDGNEPVEEAAISAALALLDALSLSGVEPPRVFSHGGDAVVLTWRQDQSRRYLTVTDEVVALLELHPKSGFKGRATFNLGDDDGMFELIQLLGGKNWQKSPKPASSYQTSSLLHDVRYFRDTSETACLPLSAYWSLDIPEGAGPLEFTTFRSGQGTSSTPTSPSISMDAESQLAATHDSQRSTAANLTG